MCGKPGVDKICCNSSRARVKTGENVSPLAQARMKDPMAPNPLSPLMPTAAERLNRMRADLRAGLACVIHGPKADLVFAASETLTAPRLSALRSLGEPCVVLTRRRAETLKARPYDGDVARVVLHPEDRLSTVHALADPAQDLNAPMKGPLHSQRDGTAALHRLALQLAKLAHLLPSVVAVTVPPTQIDADKYDLTGFAASDLSTALDTRAALKRIVSAKVPLRFAEDARLHVFRPDEGGEEHYGIEIGRPDRESPVLTRLHSACFTGDLLGSLKCDCGPQLHAALTKMGETGAGVLLYLNQEGRGIGLANKMRAYSLQDQGFDTVEANHRLGFEDDERDFRLGAAILRQMGFQHARLMTNNPAKLTMLSANGIEVAERVPLRVGQTPQNAHYLATKAAKSGHDL